MARITGTTGRSVRPAKATSTTGNPSRPTESISISKITGGAGAGPSMVVAGSGGVRRALLPRDRRDIDEASRDDRSARHHADAMSPIGGSASDDKGNGNE